MSCSQTVKYHCICRGNIAAAKADGAGAHPAAAWERSRTFGAVSGDPGGALGGVCSPESLGTRQVWCWDGSKVPMGLPEPQLMGEPVVFLPFPDEARLARGEAQPPPSAPR